jgi:hypothetical protein
MTLREMRKDNCYERSTKECARCGEPFWGEDAPVTLDTFGGFNALVHLECCWRDENEHNKILKSD